VLRAAIEQVPGPRRAAWQRRQQQARKRTRSWTSSLSTQSR
jgi:hypothetical protein